MSWFSRAKAFVSHTTAKAADIEAEFDAIEEAFNGLFASERVGATENLTLTEAFKDVPGASKSITPAKASLLIVNAVFDLKSGESATGAVGSLNVDGSDQTPLAFGNFRGDRSTVSQTYCVKLAASAHTVKLRAKVTIASGTNLCTAANTGFTYLLIPE